MKATRNWGACVHCERTIKPGEEMKVVDGELMHRDCAEKGELAQEGLDTLCN